jgi:YHS domain-containing protein
MMNAMTPVRSLLAVFAVAALACGGRATPSTGPTPPAAPTELVLVNVDEQGVGLGGHDPVAYAGGSPVLGAADQSAQHGGATYWFSSAENKAAFAGAEAKHAPQYGGYCAYAASQNRLSPSDPQVFEIVDGQLLVFTNAELRALFLEDTAGHKAKADQNWPGLVAKHGKPAAP